MEIVVIFRLIRKVNDNFTFALFANPACRCSFTR